MKRLALPILVLCLTNLVVAKRSMGKYPSKRDIRMGMMTVPWEEGRSPSGNLGGSSNGGGMPGAPGESESGGSPGDRGPRGFGSAPQAFRGSSQPDELPRSEMPTTPSGDESKYFSPVNEPDEYSRSDLSTPTTNSTKSSASVRSDEQAVPNTRPKRSPPGLPTTESTPHTGKTGSG
ncbi:complement C1q tumor necrosis factor-related protein 5 [Ixodes scapularis]|uniref:complement C1q tumor necrosis factor-related protein 5 n=1 Tax=Ixodes scapularis TaxID=6945 RepID=UPI001A9FDD2E|nr:complement C1q tumor necrosis factor-related protein 5 [Ixodes scapularis]